MSSSSSTEEGIVWKPFDGWNYGYPEDYMTYSSWLIWALVTCGSISINPVEAGLVLAGSLFVQENPELHKLLISKERIGSGASYVHNVQAGYCWYHYFLKNKRSWPVFLGTWSEIAGDLGAVGEEILRGEHVYGHQVHYNGALQGMALAFMFDRIQGNKSLKYHKLWLMPFLTLGTLFGWDSLRDTSGDERW